MSDDADETPTKPESPETPEPTTVLEPFATPAPLAPPAKKSHRGLWIALAIIAVLVLCCGGSCVGYVLYVDFQEQRVYDQADAMLTDASSQFSSAMVEMPIDDPDAMSEQLPSALDAIRATTREVRALINPLSDSEQKQAYVDALDSMDRILGQGDKVAEGLGDLGQLSTDMEAISEIVRTGDNATFDGITAANSEKWNEAESNAATAIVAYNDAIAKTAELEEAWPGVGMADFRLIIEKKRLGAEKVAALAPLGRSSKTSAYNKLINEYNGLQKEILNSGMPAFVDDPSLLTADIMDAVKEILAELEKLNTQLQASE